MVDSLSLVVLADGPVSQRLQDPIIELVNQVLNIKKMNPLDDISSLQDDLDLLFYNLYELSEDEIAIIKERVT